MDRRIVAGAISGALALPLLIGAPAAAGQVKPRIPGGTTAWLLKTDDSQIPYDGFYAKRTGDGKYLVAFINSLEGGCSRWWLGSNGYGTSAFYGYGKPTKSTISVTHRNTSSGTKAYLYRPDTDFLATYKKVSLSEAKRKMGKGRGGPSRTLGAKFNLNYCKKQ